MIVVKMGVVKKSTAVGLEIYHLLQKPQEIPAHSGQFVNMFSGTLSTTSFSPHLHKQNNLSSTPVAVLHNPCVLCG